MAYSGKVFFNILFTLASYSTQVRIKVRVRVRARVRLRAIHGKIRSQTLHKNKNCTEVLFLDFRGSPREE